MCQAGHWSYWTGGVTSTGRTEYANLPWAARKLAGAHLLASGVLVRPAATCPSPGLRRPPACPLPTSPPLRPCRLAKPPCRHVRGKVADLTNAPDHAFAGAITAALFLAEFVEPACPWVHIDTMAWNLDSRPGRPEGGEAMALRALYATLAARFSR